MNETNAAQYAQKDAEHDIALCAAALSPEDIEGCVVARTLGRIRHLDHGRVEETTARAMGERMPAPSTGMAIAHILVLPLRASLVPALEPEDARSYIRWAVGSVETGEGYGQRMIRSLGDTVHQEAALTTLIHPFLDLHRKLDESDQRLYGHFVPQLPPTARQLLQGMLLEARWATLDRDGETARNLYVRMRQAARHLLKMQERARAVGAKI